MALPEIRAVGTPAVANGSDPGAVLPTHVADDILLLFVESSRYDDTLGVSTAGWAEVADSPQFLFDSPASNSVELAVFWKRAASAAETNPVITGMTGQCAAVSVSFSGCIASGDPWDVTSGDSALSSSVVVPGDTTTVDDCLVVIAVATSRDANQTGTTFSSWANSDLANITEWIDQTFLAGAGGGLGIATGEKATAGAYGNTTVTSAATETAHAYMTIALKPPAVSVDTLTFTGQPSNAIEGVVISPDIEVTSSDNTFTGNITLAIEDNPSAGTLGGTLSQAAVSGVATFDDIEIDEPGSAYTLTASATDHTSVESDAFNITLEAATKLSFSVQPSGTAVDEVMTPSVEVSALNSEDVVDTNFTGDIVVAIDNNPGTGVLGGTLTVAAIAGVATFDDLEIDEAGQGYTLGATSTGLTAAESSAFDITAGVAINITWTDTSTIEDGFKLERNDDGAGFVQIATPAADAVSYTDDVTAGATYVYRIRSYNANGNSAYSNEDTVVVP